MHDTMNPHRVTARGPLRRPRVDKAIQRRVTSLSFYPPTPEPKMLFELKPPVTASSAAGGADGEDAREDALKQLGPSYYPEESTSSSDATKAFLSLPLQPATLYSSPSHSTSTISIHPRARSRSPFPMRKGSLWTRSKAMLYNNRGIMLVLLSQFFGSVMSLATRILETSFPEQRFHALQILFARQSITSVLVWLWLWRNRVEHAPFGPKGVRVLLIMRGVGGFFGVFGLYCLWPFAFCVVCFKVD